MTTFDEVMCQNALANQADDSLNLTYAALVQVVRADAKVETEDIKGHESDADSAVARLRSAPGSHFDRRTAIGSILGRWGPCTARRAAPAMCV